jgi:ubiquinone/menaquinone biosynthesis C-methylase UbiE
MENWQKLHNEKHVAESASELPFITFNEHNLILDIGCGRGRQIQYIKSNYGCICVGIDVVPFKLSNFLVADACHLPLRDDLFDITYSLGVIEHLKITQKAIEESIRVLRPRGQGLHSVPNMFSLHTFIERPLSNLLFKKWSVSFEQSFTPKEIKRMFYDCGFSKIQQKIVVRSRGGSKIYKLSKIESVIYQAIKEIDILMSKIIPNWGFFLFTYATKPMILGDPVGRNFGKLAS